MVKRILIFSTLFLIEATMMSNIGNSTAQEEIAPLSLGIRDFTTGLGIPSVVCELYKESDQSNDTRDPGMDSNWNKLGENVTTAQGRCTIEIPVSQFGPGNYRVVYVTEPYFQSQGLSTFYPHQEVLFIKTEEDAELPRFVVPSLAAPYGYTAYKGSTQRD